MGGDDPFRLGNGVGARREGPIAGADLFRVDQRLAVETEFDALAAGGGETLVVRKVQMNAVENCETVSAGREEAESKAGDEGQPVLRVGGA